MKIYVSGPMTGIEDFNRPAFFFAENSLLEEGHQVVNPAKVNLGPGAKWEDYMRVDLAGMLDCEGIYMLKGWEASKGANLELHIAKSLGFAVMHEVAE